MGAGNAPISPFQRFIRESISCLVGIGTLGPRLCSQNGSRTASHFPTISAIAKPATSFALPIRACVMATGSSGLCEVSTNPNRYTKAVIRSRSIQCCPQDNHRKKPSRSIGRKHNTLHTEFPERPPSVVSPRAAWSDGTLPAQLWIEDLQKVHDGLSLLSR